MLCDMGNGTMDVTYSNERRSIAKERFAARLA